MAGTAVLLQKLTRKRARIVEKQARFATKLSRIDADIAKVEHGNASAKTTAKRARAK